MQVLTCRCILRDGLISHAHHSPVCGETHPLPRRTWQDSDDLSQHCDGDLAHRFHFYRQPGARSPISLTHHHSRVDFLSQWGTMSVVLHIAGYAGAKLTGFIGEPSSPPTMCVFEGAKKHSVPFSSSTALRCTLFLTA
jgi:hypothetical protein